MNNYIIIKGGILKAYNFNDDFMAKYTKEVEEFEKIWDEIYSFDCCVFGASERNKDNKELKNKIVNILEKMYNLDVIIENGFTDEKYNDFESIKDYILNYGG